MSKKILVVDDDRLIRELLRDFFQEFGYQVFPASSGREALEILEREPIYMILLDLNMPEMDGLELCQRIRARLAEACIYAVTGYHHQYSPQNCREAGFDEFFSKPVDLHVLHNAVIRGFERLESRDS